MKSLSDCLKTPTKVLEITGNQELRGYFISEELLGAPDIAKKDIGISINSSCNLSCPYCLSQDMPLHGNMTKETFDRVIRKLREFQPRANCCILGGEPTLHPLFYDFLDELCTCVDKCIVMTNGTVPLKRLHPKHIIYQLTLHETQVSARNVSVFIENCRKILEGGLDLEVLLTFRTPLSDQVETELTRLGARDRIRQLHIDLENTEHRAKNCHSDTYILDGARLTYEQVSRFKLNRFRGWMCNFINFNVLQDGKVHLICDPSFTMDIEELDPNHQYFIECKAKECIRECYLETLKYH